MIHKVTVAKVTNPTNGHTETVSFDDWCNIIYISGGGIQFECEAYHLRSLEKEGMIVELKEFDLEI